MRSAGGWSCSGAPCIADAELSAYLSVRRCNRRSWRQTTASRRQPRPIAILQRRNAIQHPGVAIRHGSVAIRHARAVIRQACGVVLHVWLAIRQRRKAIRHGSVAIVQAWIAIRHVSVAIPQASGVVVHSTLAIRQRGKAIQQLRDVIRQCARSADLAVRQVSQEQKAHCRGFNCSRGVGAGMIGFQRSRRWLAQRKVQTFRSPRRPGHFSLRAQRKVTKRNGTPAKRLAGILPSRSACGGGIFRRCIHAPSKNGVHPAHRPSG
jgi:hypothetical protein